MISGYIVVIIGIFFPYILYRQEHNCKTALKIFKQLESEGYDISGIIEKYNQCLKTEDKIWDFISEHPEKYMPEFSGDLPTIPHELNALLFELETDIFDLQSILLQKGFTFDLLIPLRINNLFNTAWGEHKFNGNSEALRWGYYQETLARPFNIKRVAEVYRDQVIPKVYPFGPNSTDNIITQTETATSTNTTNNTKINENITNINNTNSIKNDSITNNSNTNKTDTYLIKSMLDDIDNDSERAELNLKIWDGYSIEKEGLESSYTHIKTNAPWLYGWFDDLSHPIFNYMNEFRLVKELFNIDLLKDNLKFDPYMLECIISLANLITLRNYCFFYLKNFDLPNYDLMEEFAEIQKLNPSKYPSVDSVTLDYLCNTNMNQIIKEYCFNVDMCVGFIKDLMNICISLDEVLNNLIKTGYFRVNYEAEASEGHLVKEVIKRRLIDLDRYKGKDPYLDKLLNLNKDKNSNLIKSIEEITNTHNNNNEISDYFIQWPNIYMYALTYTLLFVFSNWPSFKEIIRYYPKYYAKKYFADTYIYKYFKNFKKISKSYLIKTNKYIRTKIDKYKNIF